MDDAGYLGREKVWESGGSEAGLPGKRFKEILEMPVWLWQSLSCPGIPSEKRSYEELWLSAKKKDDEPLAGSYRAEVRETCGPAAGESG